MVKAKAQITLFDVIDIKAVYKYYLLQSATLSEPAKPTTYPPNGNWTTTEPAYTEGDTKKLYTVDCAVFGDDSFSYSEVSLSSSYEAAKIAYNKSKDLSNTLDGLTQVESDEVKIRGGKVYMDESFTNNLVSNVAFINALAAKQAFIDQLLANNITMSGTLKSSNYSLPQGETNPLNNVTGSILKMDDGTMNLGGGNLKWDGNNFTIGEGKLDWNGQKLTLDGDLIGKNINIKGNETITDADGFNMQILNGIVSAYDASSKTYTMKIYQQYKDLDAGEDYAEAALIFKNGVMWLNGAVLTSTGCESTTWPYEEFADTSGLSNVFTGGSITVTKKLGWCHVYGGIRISKTIADWTNILNNVVVPPPQDRTSIFLTIPYWASSFVRPLRIDLMGNGGIKIRYGAAGEYRFSVTYPID
jgi:hypothetical protein